LKRISGCEEWGIKVFGLGVQPPAATEMKSGRDYLEARAAALRTEAPRDGGPEVQRLLRALEAVAIETAPGSGAVSRGQRGLQWQGSLLVKREQRKKLQQVMARFSREWERARRLEVSGPWAALFLCVAAAEERGWARLGRASGDGGRPTAYRAGGTGRRLFT
jgi:hypothetical protein